MSITFLSCVLIAFAWIGLFFLWGRSFLTLIKVERDVASSIAFGYLVLQIIYQIIYLPFFLCRGSYRATVYIWMSIVGIASIGLMVYLRKHRSRKRNEIKVIEKVGVCGAVILVLGLGAYISLHVPFNGVDTVTYISTMNNAYYYDQMWITNGTMSIHHGLCSMLHLFTISSFLFVIKPYYTSFFIVRIVGICFFALIMYRIGVIVFCKGSQKKFSWPALALSVLTPTLLMFWGSNYTAEFFYWRINEGKGFCQFVLMPLGFSIFLEMFKVEENRKILWKEQFIVGLASIAISSSSMTSYIFLIVMGTCAVLAYDKLKSGWRTIGCAVICTVPNLLYLVLYVLVDNRIILF